MSKPERVTRITCDGCAEEPDYRCRCFKFLCIKCFFKHFETTCTPTNKHGIGG